MENQKDQKEPEVKEMYGLRLTLDESLEKYKAPEYQSPKRAKVRETFKNGVVILIKTNSYERPTNRKKATH